MFPNMTKVDAIIREVAASEVLPRFQNLSHAEIREKNPGDIVTIADERAEAALVEGPPVQEVYRGRGHGQVPPKFRRWLS